jgi:hypothetical protein
VQASIAAVDQHLATHWDGSVGVDATPVATYARGVSPPRVTPPPIRTPPTTSAGAITVIPTSYQRRQAAAAGQRTSSCGVTTPLSPSPVTPITTRCLCREDAATPRPSPP